MFPAVRRPCHYAGCPTAPFVVVAVPDAHHRQPAIAPSASDAAGVRPEKACGSLGASTLPSARQSCCVDGDGEGGDWSWTRGALWDRRLGEMMRVSKGGEKVE
eukprot:TRINITY_DN17652_c0_g1_i8.p1 TRINITY_DN17652_c0_g1~~TRINITY_DN17652_c0_g1_i8.p1  ORF type:complete len:103 (-),score=14.31 TRINITY_DN17652_c0_g1_i8:472-780(-)